VSGIDQPSNESAVVEELRSRITTRGRITFAEFMEVALYLPGHGYYASATDVIGPDGDFYTSPYVHPIFGELVCEQLYEMWLVLGRPEYFQIVEMGANKGLLCYDILRQAAEDHADFLAALSYVVVETRPGTAGVDADAAGGLAAKVTVFPAGSEIESLGPVVGCFLSNELVDAFPVHVVTWEGGSLKEVYVTLSGENFVEVTGEPSSESVVEYVRKYGINKEDGCYAEVGLQADRWIEGLAKALDRGFALTIDYGDLAERLYSPATRHGTLMCYYHHHGVDNPYVRVGRQDITVHVNFSALIRAGEENRLDCLGLTTQAEFLAGLGIGAFLPSLMQETADASAYQKTRASIMNLLDPLGLGGFKVLVQQKGAPGAKLNGLSYRL
jgi:SAM-dependent MidA family methyltransferase